MGYADGFVVPVPEGKKEAYREMAAKAAPIFQEYGATRVVEAWGDDVPDGKVTDFRRAVKAEDGENVVFSWIEWPSKEARDEGWAKIMEDERMKPDHDNMPFDGKRMFWGGFAPILDVGGRRSLTLFHERSNSCPTSPPPILRAWSNRTRRPHPGTARSSGTS